MSTCYNCGIMELRNEQGYCVKYHRQLKAEQITANKDCLYFIEVEYENGERLSPQEHLAIIDAELRAKKMKGPLG